MSIFLARAQLIVLFLERSKKRAKRTHLRFPVVVLKLPKKTVEYLSMDSHTNAIA